MYSFITAKYWGRGPRYWTIQEIKFKTQTGKDLLESPAKEDSRKYGLNSTTQELKPRKECHWVIHHYDNNDYKCLSDQSDDKPDTTFNIEDNESNWPTWNCNVDAATFSQTINEGLNLNAFNRCSDQNVPFSTKAFTGQRRKSDRQRKQEDIGFAIISRNVNLLRDLLESNNDDNPDQNNYPIINREMAELINTIGAFHLAATYLDGSRSCCLVFDALSSKYHQVKHKRDQFGHTVLDCIFLTILRSHTKVSPGAVSNSLRGTSRFAGEEVDIYGRWDADSPCIRQLYAKGQSNIPFKWKHKFYHTSVQTICHSIINIFKRDFPFEINMPSGLFRSICEHYGHECSGSHFHALIMVAYHLAKYGTPNETLFKALACLICLIFCRGNPFRKATLAVPGSHICDHQPITPLKLSEALSHSASTDHWSKDARTGWLVFVMTLKYIAFHHNFGEEELHEIDIEDIELNRWQGLGLLWGAIQAEFLTYRRLTDNDSALSPRFDMLRLLQELQAGNGPFGIDWIEEDVMAALADGGFFTCAENAYCPLVHEVCTEYVANVEQWGRIKFINVPWQ